MHDAEFRIRSVSYYDDGQKLDVTYDDLRTEGDPRRKRTFPVEFIAGQSPPLKGCTDLLLDALLTRRAEAMNILTDLQSVDPELAAIAKDLAAAIQNEIVRHTERIETIDWIVSKLSEGEKSL